MKLPIQARPIMRGAGSAKISGALMSGVTASECDMGKCGGLLALCAAFAPGGPVAVGTCLSANAASGCRGCIGQMIDNLMSGAGGGGGGGTGRDHYDSIS